ncbi:MAG: Hpt domain-containing protein [Dehalococcoidia bacterium]|nr:Hpt domain-containing protein [Dehalococcoidia bacterium]
MNMLVSRQRQVTKEALIKQCRRIFIDMDNFATKQNGKIIAEVDEDLEELIPEFLKNRQSDIATISKSLQLGEFETIRILGHSMRGSGGCYGFDGITEIGAAIEKAAKASATDAIRELTDELIDYLERVQIVYRPY